MKTGSSGAVLLLVLGIAAAGCAGGQGPGAVRSTAPAGVLNRTWQWQGTLTPVERITVAQPERYTVLLTGNGRVQAQFDCNRGGGDYRISEGRLSFGPLLSTRRACPDDTQDALFKRDLQRVQSFFLEDGKLFLEMPLDSGTMRFREIP